MVFPWLHRLLGARYLGGHWKTVIDPDYEEKLAVLIEALSSVVADLNFTVGARCAACQLLEELIKSSQRNPP